MRLAGTRLVNWYGCDFTGRCLDELDFGDVGASSFALLDQIVVQVCPGHMSGKYVKQNRRGDMLVGAAVRLASDQSIVGDSLGE